MRFSAIFPLLCAVTALILSLLCLFAGSKSSFLQDAELLTLNVSRIGHTPLFNTSKSGNFITQIIDDIEEELNKLLEDAESDIASFFDLKDFYTVHIMNYCEGYYEPNATATQPSENITHCSNTTAFFHFDPTQVIENELRPGLNLTSIHWPHKIEEATHAVELAAKIMFVFYVIGIIFAGLAVLGAAFSIFSDGRISAFLNFLLDLLAFLSLGIASAISTAIIIKVVHAINKDGKDIGIAASKGTKFLGMTWASVAVMLLASFVWITECVRGRKRVQGEKRRY